MVWKQLVPSFGHLFVTTVLEVPLCSITLCNPFVSNRIAKERLLGELERLLQALQGYLNTVFLGVLLVFCGKDFYMTCLPKHVSEKESKVHLDDASCTGCRSLEHPLVPQLLVLL